MTDLRDPAETRVIFHQTADTAVIGDATRNLAPYIAVPPALRRPEVTGEIPAYDPATIGVVDQLQEPPTGAPPPLPPPPPPSPSWAAEAGEYPTVPGYRIVVAESTQVRPRGYRPEHRREMPFWAGLVLHLTADVVGSALGAAAVLLWAVTR